MLVGVPIAIVAAAIFALISCGRGLGVFFVAIVILGVVLINYLFEVLGLIGRVRNAIRPEESA
jgi:hypothetical protein